METTSKEDGLEDDDQMSSFTLEAVQTRMQSLEKNNDELQQRQQEQEAEFGHKRAAFRDMFMKQEEELAVARDRTEQNETEMAALREQLRLYQNTIDDLKTQFIMQRTAWQVRFWPDAFMDFVQSWQMWAKEIVPVTITETMTQDEIGDMNRKCGEELATVQHIMQEAQREAEEALSEERQRHHEESRRLETEVHELRTRLGHPHEGDGVLPTVLKNMKKGAFLQSPTHSPVLEPENLEDSMRQAEKDTEILRSVVLPLEEEIAALREKLQRAEERVRMLEVEPKPSLTSIGLDTTRTIKTLLLEGGRSSPDTSLREEMKELSHVLQAEKSSRCDLEMYVSVLNTQKSVLQEDNETLRKELHTVCQLLDGERKQHEGLKRTWQAANDQFLAAQRLQMADLRRLESVLAPEQQRQVAELQKRDAEREEEERRQRANQQQQEQQEQQQQMHQMHRDSQTPERQRSPSLGKRQAQKQLAAQGMLTFTHTPNLSVISLDSSTRSVGPLTDLILEGGEADDRKSMQSEEFGEFVSAEGEFLVVTASSPSYAAAAIKKASSTSCITDALAKNRLTDSGVLDSSLETRSLQDVDAILSRWSPEKQMNMHQLTADQHKALADLTPEMEQSQTLLAAVRAQSVESPHFGKRVVSDKEWEWLQQEIRSARDKLGRPCDMCCNYEAQLQGLQVEQRQNQDQVRMLQKQLERYKMDLERENKSRGELEASLQNAAGDAQTQISTMTKKVQEMERSFSEVEHSYETLQKDLTHNLKRLTEDRTKVQEEVARLQSENDSLMGKHSATAAQMQSENIDLPNTLEDLQYVMLKRNEELIAAKVSKEHLEETLRGEILFLKDQLHAEQHAKDTIEDTLTQEADTMRQQLGIQSSIKSELEREQKLRKDIEQHLNEAETTKKNIQAKGKQVIQTLQAQLEEQSASKRRLEEEHAHLKAKLVSQQGDLENSEAVQRDFVKLSQHLQVQLESLRQSNTDVRWKHEDDCDDCHNCHQAFTVTRRKRHCRHCGKVFCHDCTSKIVHSGPHRRQSKVCDVCHTLLVKDSAPYFSTEPPPTPT